MCVCVCVCMCACMCILEKHYIKYCSFNYHPINCIDFHLL